jgi:hypothetical protein
MKHEAIYILYPNAVQIDDTVGVTDIDGNIISIDEDLVNNKIIELQTEYNNKQYQRNRAEAYPSLQEQMDMQYWDKVNGTNNWETKIAEIKALYPKPTE